MALPQDGQNANGLTKVTEVPAGKELIFIDPTTNEGGIITLENLTTQILKKLTSQTFALDQGTKTLPAALNELNSKSFFYDKENKFIQVIFRTDKANLFFEKYDAIQFRFNDKEIRCSGKVYEDQGWMIVWSK